MFSANENIVLRQHKRRVIEYIESTIPENALDLGTSVMVMQVSCRQPGCVPLETVITVVFPRPPSKKKKKKSDAKSDPKENDNSEKQKEEVPSFPKPLLPDLEESRIGGSFKTRILKPLSDVTKDDVLDALPPSFEGGRRTTESLCMRARDMTFAQIGQLVGNDDTTDSREGRKLVAEFLKVCLGEYIERGCVPPEWGEPFAALDGEEKKEDTPQAEELDAKSKKDTGDVASSGNATTMDDKWGKGNFVFTRPDDEEGEDHEVDVAPSRPKIPSSKYKLKASTEATAKYTTISSQQLLQQISKSEHAPGIRRAGCPCCDPDGASTYVDKMMGL